MVFTLPEAGRQQGENLCIKLYEPEQKQLRDLAKNPLLLTLLCLDWRSRQGKLPRTRVCLYQQFVEDYYDWKQREFPVKLQQRKLLNQKMGELALAAFKRKTSRIYLQEDFVRQFMGEPADEKSLFFLALKLGFISKAGKDDKNPRKFVYVFLHQTLEDYFAALSVATQFQEGILTLEEIEKNIFGRYPQHENWSERTDFLLLICGMLGVAFSENIIRFLIRYFELRKHLASQKEEANCEVDEDLDFTDAFAEKYKFTGNSLILASLICQEVEAGFIHDEVDKKLKSSIQICLKEIEDFIESAGQYTWDYWAEDCIYHAFRDMLLVGKGYRYTFQYLASKSCDAELQEICSVAVRALVDNWENDQELMNLLIKVALENPFDTLTFTDYDLNIVRSPRQTALEALFVRYSHCPRTFKVFQDLATNDKDQYVRSYASKILAQLTEV